MPKIRINKKRPRYIIPKQSPAKISLYKDNSKPSEVSIIIPLYKSKDFILKQIENWHDDFGCELIYIDDCCPQQSYKYIDNGKILKTNRNCGYGTACNLAATYATGKYLIFLNADCIVTPNWIKPLYEYRDAGIVGNLQLKENGNIDSAGSEWSWKDGSFLHIGKHIYQHQLLDRPLNYLPDDLKEVAEREMITGCCFMISANLFREVGGFDSIYRIGYWEDADLNLNIRSKGYKVLYQPNSVIYHYGGHSGGGQFFSQNKEKFYEKWVHNYVIDDYIREPRQHKKVKLNILTPSIRQHNLPKIKNYIKKYNNNILDLTWIIVLDLNEIDKEIEKELAEDWIRIYKYREEKSIKGIAQFNYGLDQIKDGFIWGIADDNIPHPNFFLRLKQVILGNQNKKVIIVSEDRLDGRILHAEPNCMRKGHVDGSQAIIKKELYPKITYDECGDGVMIENLFNKNSKEFLFIDEVLAYFEGLK